MNEKATILLIDDDSIDRRAIISAFKSAKISNPIIEVKHGEEGLEVLRGENGRTQLAQPYIILLDINMPVMDGHEFLKEVRADPKLEDSVIFVLTTSDSDEDKCKAYKQHIAGYLLKDHIGRHFLTKVHMLDLFMISIEYPIGATASS